MHLVLTLSAMVGLRSEESAFLFSPTTLQVSPACLQSVLMV